MVIFTSFCKKMLNYKWFEVASAHSVSQYLSLLDEGGASIKSSTDFLNQTLMGGLVCHLFIWKILNCV